MKSSKLSNLTSTSENNIIFDELFTNNDHRLNNDSESIDGSHSDSFPKPSTKIDLG